MFVALTRGRHALINIIFSLYLALLVALKFPYFSLFIGTESKATDAVVMIVIFLIFTALGMFLFRKHLLADDYERAFEHFWSKFALAIMATILVMAYSYHALPVTELITPGSPIQALFAPEQNFFWWLMLPLVVLFFVY
jgi:amino acid transporter